MKQVLFIGDIHGRDDWYDKAHSALSRFIEVVFLGDYVDSFDVNPYYIKENLERIIEFKKVADKSLTLPNVTLLLGNHDMSYVWGKAATDGFKAEGEVHYKDIFMKNWDIFDIAWGYQGKESYTLATHAGLREDFWTNEVTKQSEYIERIHGSLSMPMHVRLNYLKNKEDVYWRIGWKRGGGYYSASPIWADWSELLEKPLNGINQIVGHTAKTPPIIDLTTSPPYFIAKLDGDHGTAMMEFTLE